MNINSKNLLLIFIMVFTIGFISCGNKKQESANPQQQINDYDDEPKLKVEMINGINSEGDSSVSNITVFNNRLYFTANNGTKGSEPWVYDPSVSSKPEMLDDIRIGVYGSTPQDGYSFFTVLDNKLYFSADEHSTGYDTELWKYDPENTVTPLEKAVDIRFGGSSAPEYLTVFRDKLYFSADDTGLNRELWVYDPATLSANMVDEINTTTGSYPSEFAVFDEKLYFKAKGGDNTNTKGYELWSYDGINAPSIVDDIYLGIGNSNPAYLTVMNGILYFSADNGSNGRELMFYDGITTPEKVININSGANYDPKNLMVFNNKLYFSADDTGTNRELWVYDPSDDSTPKMVFDINTGDDKSSNPEYLTVFDGKLYFSAKTEEKGSEIWSYDGVNNPSMVYDLAPDTSGSYPSHLTVLGDSLYFSASKDDPSSSRELWRLFYE